MKKKPLILATFLSTGIILAGCGGNDTETDVTTNEEETQTEQPAENAEEPAQDENMEEPASEDEASGNEMEGTDDAALKEDIDSVMASVKALREAAQGSKKDVAPINEKGKALEANWDGIEKQVEEQYPDQYKKIEESLYPLIEEAKKDTPDVEKIDSLIAETQDMLESFKDKLSNESSS
ncbi:hypothetical protein LC040_13950 [Bacillus tianshenii]|nr:hypothetical protein LC040_13950 [Bacillus tianshenii]